MLCLEPEGVEQALTVSKSTVNQLKAARAWDETSDFDAEKDKAKFRQYEDACDRVKTFYKEQHGMAPRPCSRRR